MDTPKIGIILVNYNGYKDTVDCINSIRNSKYTKYKIYVVDNNSDGDCEVLENIKDIELIRLKNNLGFGIANNIGADKALKEHCDYLLILNNDTIVTEEFLSTIVSWADKKTIVTCKINYFFDKNKTWYGGGEASRILGNFRHKCYEDNREISFVCGCCMLVPVDVYKHIGLFDEKYFMYCEDGDFSIKAILNGYKILYVNDALIYHKVGASAGKINGFIDYYANRNKLYLLNKYKGYFTVFAIIYFYLSRLVTVFKRALQGKTSKNIFLGIKDYYMGNLGKTYGN